MARPFLEECVCLICGQPGSGKSMLCTQAILNCDTSGVSYAYLPLEDDATHFLRRCAAMLQEDFEVMENPQRAKEALAKHEATLANIQKHVVGNPRRAQRDEDGRIRATRINGKMVLDWTQEMVKDHRIVFIDSLAMISHDTFQQWRAEDDLISDLVAIAQASKTTVVLICHTIKKPGASQTMGLADVQGATGFTRKAQGVLLLDGHPARDNVVYDAAQPSKRRIVTHTRTMVIAKARNGSGTGKRIAFTFGHGGNPRFVEQGLILSKREQMASVTV
jgi:KaiC/GvpD/RAD55 family RecA-like ATPase